MSWGVTGRRRLPVASACLILLAAAVPASAAGACANASAARLSAPAAAASLRCLLNAERARHGMAPVRANARLRRAAARHSADMVRRRYFAHVSPGGSTPEARVARTGYLRGARAWVVGEALARAAAPPRGILRMLLDSPPHRAILLDPEYRDLGLGVAPAGGRLGLMVTFDLGLVRR